MESATAQNTKYPERRNGMIKFAELKAEIDEQKARLEETEERITKLKNRRSEISAKIADLDAARSGVDSEQKKAVARFARDEIPEESLDKVQAELLTLDSRRKAFIDAIDVVDSDLAAAEAAFTQIKGLLKNKEETAWRIIADAELEKAASTLHRAFVASNKGQSFAANPGDFLKKYVYDAVFCVAQSKFAQVVFDLEAEYFGE
jgi:chromosome segregation ATPase